MPEIAPINRSVKSPLSALSALMTTVVIWGGSFVASKICLREISPLALVTIRFVTSSLLFAPIVISYMRRGERITRWDLLLLTLLGMLGMTFYIWIQNIGIFYTTASKASLLISLAPIWIAFLSRRILGEPLTVNKVVGIALAFTGAIWVVVSKESSGLLEPGRNDLLGGAMILLNTLCWAFYSISSKRVMVRYNPLFLTGIVMILGTISLMPFSLLYGRVLEQVNHLSARGWWGVAFLALGSSSLAYFCWYYALKKLEASKVGVYLYLEPLVTIIIATLLLKEVITWQILAGGSLIIGGVYLVSYR